MKRKNVLGWALILFGAVSLIFGWPWGSLIGAILVLAGVLALKLQPPQPPKLLQAPELPPTEQAQKEDVHGNAESESGLLLGVIQEMKRRGEPIPTELIRALQHDADSKFEECCENVETSFSKNWDMVVDLSAFGREIRSNQGWPTEGSIMGHPNASEELDYVLMRIEALAGRVPLREAFFLTAMLDSNGFEAAFLQWRQKGGYPSLYDNELHLEWSANPGFYERQLQRRHNNVLFPFAKRRVSRQDLYIARQLDAAERVAFLDQWKHFLEKFLRVADIVPASEATNHLHELYELIEKAALIGGETTEQAKQIQSAYQTLLAQVYDAVKDNPEATKALRSAEEARWSSSALLLNPRIRQILRITDKADIVPALLSEDLETIRSTVETLDTATLDAVRVTVLQMLNESPDMCELLRQQPQKLEALGIPKEKIPA